MSQSSSQLVALATKILEQAGLLEAYNNSHNVPPPSFHESAAIEPTYPIQQEKTRAAISDACEELNALVQGPRKMMQSKFMGHVVYYDIIHRFKIASKIPKDGRTSYSALSTQTGVSEVALRRILRFAIANHVFAEPSPGYIAHSAASRMLVDDPTMADWLGAAVQEIVPAQVAEGRAIAEFPEADEAARTGYMLANNATAPSFYLHMAKDAARVKQFSSAMSGFVRDKGHALSHLVDNYPWGELGAGTVVDLGGSTGGAAFAIAKRNPALKLIVQDLPDTVATAKEQPGLNVTFMAHSFFDEQPVKGADVYMSRWCFHNWSDKYCIKILHALVPALKPGARILVMDAVLPQTGTIPTSEEQRLRNFDVNMLALSNSMERELEDWKSLFAQVDRRFRWKGVTQPEGSNLALIEAVWQPDQAS